MANVNVNASGTNSEMKATNMSRSVIAEKIRCLIKLSDINL